MAQTRDHAAPSSGAALARLPAPSTSWNPRRCRSSAAP